MKIRKGDVFRCKKDVVMDTEEIAYRAGKEYVSEYDNCITDEHRVANHVWYDDLEKDEDLVSDYFEKITRPSSEELIIDECDKIKELLLSKNRKYGDSALTPGMVYNLPATTAIKARINDKIARLKNDNKDEDEDLLLDIPAYFILLRIAKRLEV